MSDPFSAYAGQLYGPAPAAPAPTAPSDPISAYAAQLAAQPAADPDPDFGNVQGRSSSTAPSAPSGRFASLGAGIAAAGGQPGLGSVPPSSALQDVLQLAKITGQGAAGTAGSVLAAAERLGGPGGFGQVSDGDLQGILAAAALPGAPPGAAAAMSSPIARGSQALQQGAQASTEQYLSQDPGSPLRQAAAFGANAAGQVGPTTLMPLAGGEAAGALAEPYLEQLALRAPVTARLLGMGAKLAGAGAEGTAFGIGNADPDRPLMDQLPEIAQQAAIGAGTAGLVEGLRAIGDARAPVARPDAAAIPSLAPAGPPEGFSAAPVDPKLGYAIDDRSTPGSAARTLGAVGDGGSGELDYHRAAGGGFIPTDLRVPPDAPPEVARALYQAAAEIEGPHAGDLAPDGPVQAASAAIRQTDPDVFGDYRATVPALTSEELAAFTPGTSDAVGSPANADLVQALGDRAPWPADAPPPVARAFPTYRDPAELAETRAAIPLRVPSLEEMQERMVERQAPAAPPDAQLPGAGGWGASWNFTHAVSPDGSRIPIAGPEAFGDTGTLAAAGMSPEARQQLYEARQSLLDGQDRAGLYDPTVGNWFSPDLARVARIAQDSAAGHGPLWYVDLPRARAAEVEVVPNGDSALPPTLSAQARPLTADTPAPAPDAKRYFRTVPPEEARARAAGSWPEDPALKAARLRHLQATDARFQAAGRGPLYGDDSPVIQRVKAALLNGAIGDPELAERVTNHADPQVRAIGDAVGSVAPTLEPLRRGAAAGELAPLGIQDELRGALARVADPSRPAPRDPTTAAIGDLMRDNAAHPEEIAKGLHRYAELHLLADREAPIAKEELARAAFDPAERQRAGQIIPLEESTPVSLPAKPKPIIGKPGEQGFISLSSRGQRFGTSSPLSRWFSVDGKFAAMGDDLRGFTKAAVNTKDFNLLARSGQITAEVRDFGGAFDRYYQAMRKVDPAVERGPLLDHAMSYLRGETDGADLPRDLRLATDAMRRGYDANTDRMLSTPGFIGPSMKETLEANRGTYAARTFERYTNPDAWAKKVFEDPREKWRLDAFTEWAMGEHPEWTEDNARGYARQLLLDDPGALRDTVALQKGNIGSQGRENLIRRIGAGATDETSEGLFGAGLPRQIDDLLGLHRDPAMSYQIGAMRAARDLEVYDLHMKLLAKDQQIAASGGRPLFTLQPTEDGPLRIGGNGPLKNLHTSPEVAAVIRGTDSTSGKQALWLRSLLTANGYWKTGVTALNFPAAPLRNLLSWHMQYLAGGHFTEAMPGVPEVDIARHMPMLVEANLGTKYGAILKLQNALRESIQTADGAGLREQTLAARRAEIYKLRELGVLGQSTMRADLEAYNPLEHGGPKAAQNVVRNLGAAWSIEHDGGKHLYWRAERSNLAWANPSMAPELLDQLAAERTRAATPTRSEVVPAARAMRANPFVGPFPSWHAESVRNTLNNLRIGLTDLADDNPRMKVLGAKRLAGLTVASLVRYGAIPAVASWLFNTDERHVDALRKLMPEYYRNTVAVVTSRAGGLIRYLSLSPYMPQSSWQDAVDAVLRGVHEHQPVDGLIDGISEWMNHFIDPEAIAKTGIDLAYNQQRRGSLLDQAMNPLRTHPRTLQGPPVYLEGAGAATAAPQAGAFLWRNLAPGAAREGERMARASGDFGLSNVNARGKQYNMSDEEASLAGIRFSTIDANAALASTGHDLNQAITDSKGYYSQQRSQSQNDPRTALEAKGAANAKYKTAWDEAADKVQAARQLGVPDGAIFGNLVRSGLPPRVARQVMAGQFQPLTLTKPYRPPRDLVGEGMEGLQ